VQTDLQTFADQLSADLACIRTAALDFAEQIEGSRGTARLASFNQVAYFNEASKAAYGHLVGKFKEERGRYGVCPEIDDHDIRMAFKDRAKVRNNAGLKELDIKAAVDDALAGLDQLLPESEVESVINSQLAGRVFNVLGLARMEVVEKAGKTLLKYSAITDSISKKWSGKNNYCYHTTDRIRDQIAVLHELVSAFNLERDEAYSTLVPQWTEINGYGKDLSRSPYVVEVLGLELKLRVSSFEWHLPQEFATFMSEFISLHHGR